MITTSKIQRTTLQALVLLGLAGGLLSSSALAIAALLLGLAGLLAIKRGSLSVSGWDTPRELRFLHFAFWFYVAVSVFGWSISGFSYLGFKDLGNPARLILFWPIVVAITYSGLSARGLFVGFGLMALSATAVVAVEFASNGQDLAALLRARAGGDLNAITFGNLALLSGTTSLVGALLYGRQRDRLPTILLLIAGAGALFAAFLSQTRSNFLALSTLLFLFLPLIKTSLRVPALVMALLAVASLAMVSDRAFETFQGLMDGQLDQGTELRLEAWSIAWELFLQHPLVGAGLDGYSIAATAAAKDGAVPSALLDCCTGHAHNDLLHLMATRGSFGLLAWLFLIGIPLWIFSRYTFSPNTAISHTAVAGTMVPVAYLLFGLTEATLDRSVFLTFYMLMVASLACVLFTELSRSFTRSRSVKVTATVITKNEADNIADCLLSVRQVVDEIIVLDSGSSDGTAEIAREHADVVEVTDWPGFGVQKQRALERATGEWVLSIDADERITSELAREINHCLAAPDADAYKLPWAVTLYGKRLDFGRSGRAPLRLFRREGVSFSDALVHERILIPKGRKIKTLHGRLTHYTHRDFGHSLEKSAKYAWLGSLEKHRKGKRSRTLIYPTFRGLLTFLHVYFIRFGFLDGAVGYLTAVTYAQVTFNKYAGLWTLDRQNNSASSRTPTGS